MNDYDFYDSFRFCEVNLNFAHDNDSSSGAVCHYLGFMKDGIGKLVSEDKQIEVYAGDLFYIPKDCRYKSYWRSKDNIRFDSFGFLHMPNRENFTYSLQKLSYNDADYRLLVQLSEHKNVSAVSVGLLYTLIGRLEAGMEKNMLYNKNHIVETAVRYMNDNPTALMGDVARFCQISESMLYFLFKKHLSKTPNRVRQEVQCARAAELLKNTDLSVEEICDKLDFSSSSYFRKVFFSVTNKTPTGFRKEYMI